MKKDEMDPLLKTALRGAPAPVSAACVDAERLAAWSDGTLSAREAGEVEQHLSTCARCQAMLATFARTGSTMPAAAPSWWRRPVGWLVPVAAAAAVALVWIALPKRPLSPAPAVSQQAASLEKQAPPVAPAQAPAAFDRIAPTANKLDAPKAEQKAASGRPARAATAPAAAPLPQPQLSKTPPAASVTVPAAAPVVETKRTTTGARQALVLDEAIPRPVEIVEIVAPEQPAQISTGVGRGGAGGRGGGRAGAGTATGAVAGGILQAPTPPTRWRILATGHVQRSTSDGASWDAVTIDTSAELTGGVATSSTICWLIGRAGAVFRAVDGLHFERLPFPQAVDLSSIRATGAAQATVTTADGRTFTTSDGGLTWVQGFPTSPF